MSAGTTTEHVGTDPENPADTRSDEGRGNEMERRRLGGSGLQVSVFSMGTMTFGDESDEPESHAMLDRFVEAGGTFIDTADAYAQGRSEQFIGRWLASRSDLRPPRHRHQGLLLHRSRRR